MDILEFRNTIDRAGWIQFEAALSPDLVAGLCEDLDSACRICRAIQVQNGIDGGTDGTAHHMLGLGRHFLLMLEQLPVSKHVDAFFGGGKYIINSFGGVNNRPGAQTYVGKVHRDIRSFSGSQPWMLNMLVMLDRFTTENGATHFLEGSHLAPERPDDEAFFRQAVQVVGGPGTIVLFNSNLWHAAGVNRTTGPRRAITITLTPPYFKQQCDYPRMLGYERSEEFSPQVRQLLGYNARVPASLDEWYQPPQKRFYQRDQG